MTRAIPFRFESLARDAKHLLLGRVIDKNIASLGIHSHDDNVVKWPVRATALQADDQGPSLFQMMLQIAPIPWKGEGSISGFLKVGLHAAGGDAALGGREQGLLDLSGVREFRRRLSVFISPILKHHRNGG